MVELKTLKDMDEEGFTYDYITKRNLRQLAIKYARQLEVRCSKCGKILTWSNEGELECEDYNWNDDLPREDNHDFMVSSYSDLGVYNFIKEFFNLSDEDIFPELNIKHKGL